SRGGIGRGGIRLGGIGHARIVPASAGLHTRYLPTGRYGRPRAVRLCCSGVGEPVDPGWYPETSARGPGVDHGLPRRGGVPDEAVVHGAAQAAVGDRGGPAVGPRPDVVELTAAGRGVAAGERAPPVG